MRTVNSVYVTKGSTPHSIGEQVEFLKLACLIGVFVDSVL